MDAHLWGKINRVSYKVICLKPVGAALLTFRDGLVEVLRGMLSMHRHPPEEAEDDDDEKVGRGTPENGCTQDEIEPNPRVLTVDQVQHISFFLIFPFSTSVRRVIGRGKRDLKQGRD